MGVIDTLKNLADGATSVQKIHDTGKYFHDAYITPLGKQKYNVVALSLNVPTTVKVNQSVTLWGTGTGMISLYSGDHLERELYPDKSGKWYIRLFFSVAGVYKMKAKDYYGEVIKELTATD